jgi:hypothetical protein
MPEKRWRGEFSKPLKKNSIIFILSKKTQLMSYPSKLKLEPELALTLFLILALQSDKQIKNLTLFSNGTLGNYKKRLMKLFFDEDETDELQIFYAAKENPELVEYLVAEYKDKYPTLVATVRRPMHLTVKMSLSNGHKEAYIWPATVQ